MTNLDHLPCDTPITIFFMHDDGNWVVRDSNVTFYGVVIRKYFLDHPQASIAYVAAVPYEQTVHWNNILKEIRLEQESKSKTESETAEFILYQRLKQKYESKSTQS